MPIFVVSLIQPAGFIPPVSMVKSLDITKELKADAKQFLESAKLKAAKKGIILRTKIMDGHPGPDILRVAQNKNNKIDLIVVGSRGRSSVKELFLGSTSNYIVHKAKVPVLLVK
jgi:nucleotide-binding universal stress UspA family protein